MKVAVLGLGSIGVRHAKNLTAIGCDVLTYDPLHIKGLSRQDAIDGAEAVVIASPSSEHLVDLRDCIDASKHALVEKPIAIEDSAAVCHYLGRSDDRNLVVTVANNLRFHPCVTAAKNWIGQGHIGKPLWANFICAGLSAKAPDLSGGVILNAGSHEVDLALHLFGPAWVVGASADCNDHGDVIADFVLQHEGGTRSSFHLDYVTKQEVREFWVGGEEKNIGADLLSRRAILGGFVNTFGGGYDADYLAEMKAFIDRCEGKEAPGATGDDGLAVLEVLLDVRRKAGLE